MATQSRLPARVGFGAIKLDDRTVHSLQVQLLELDEAWSFVGKKQRRCTPADGIVKGDLYVFLGRRLVREGHSKMSYRSVGRVFPSRHYKSLKSLISVSNSSGSGVFNGLL